MSVSESYMSFVQEQLAGVGDVSVRKMFGGAGVYCDGVMFALIADETLYFRTDETTARQFEAEGCEPFTYTPPSPRQPIRMPYWRVPEHLYEDSDEMRAWAETALAVARRLKSEKRPRQKRAEVGNQRRVKPSKKGT